MVTPYMMIHFGKPGAEAVGAILAGAALGLVALRTRSIYAGMAIHIAVAWSMDLLALWRKGKLGNLLGFD
jgi:membrane protease YdiL (CAAX protease family)